MPDLLLEVERKSDILVLSVLSLPFSTGAAKGPWGRGCIIYESFSLGQLDR